MCLKFQYVVISYMTLLHINDLYIPHQLFETPHINRFLMHIKVNLLRRLKKAQSMLFIAS